MGNPQVAAPAQETSNALPAGPLSGAAGVVVVDVQAPASGVSDGCPADRATAALRGQQALVLVHREAVEVFQDGSARRVALALGMPLAPPPRGLVVNGPELRLVPPGLTVCPGPGNSSRPLALRRTAVLGRPSDLGSPQRWLATDRTGRNVASHVSSRGRRRPRPTAMQVRSRSTACRPSPRTGRCRTSRRCSAGCRRCRPPTPSPS